MSDVQAVAVTAPIRILYLDDDDGLGVLLSRSLAPHGYLVETVTTGDEALARLSSEHFHVLAMDHNLTNEVGLDVMPRVQALPGSPPIIYVTGSEDVRIAVAALKAGAVDYVWKDVQGHYRELLRQSVDTAIEQQRLKQAQEEHQRQIAEARDRAELLLKEVNHRVANSLAIVSSLLQMQAQGLADESAKAALKESQARIHAIAGVHKRLYTSADVRVVEVNSYLSALVEELEASLKLSEVHIRFAGTGEDLVLATDKAVSLGIIVTELLTNAAKYAYPEGVAGEIRVRTNKLADGKIEVQVADDGVGWKGDGPVRGSGMGTRIVKAMTASLQSELRYEPVAKGTCAALAVPASSSAS
jgi:two-component sensor histidine kinase